MDGAEAGEGGTRSLPPSLLLRRLVRPSKAIWSWVPRPVAYHCVCEESRRASDRARGKKRPAAAYGLSSNGKESATR